MNWIRENKFLAGFFGFVIAGAVALTVLLVMAYNQYAEYSDIYANQANELKRLQAKAPYPDEKNLEKYKEQKKLLGEAISGLQENLSAIEFPLEPMTPELFQDRLRASINAVGVKAAENGLKLSPAVAAMGFDRYQTETPGKDAATPLGRQLKAIEFIVNELLGSKVNSITTIHREPLPEESGKKTSAQTLVAKYPFQITFVVEQNRFRKLLNDIVGATQQFYIVRQVRIKNQVEKGPLKTSDAAAAPTAPADARLHYIVGNEKLEVALTLEIVDFAAPSQK